MRTVIVLILISFISISCGSGQESDWINLFNGRDLTGWKQLNGEAKFEVIEGMIVGTTVRNTPSTFLCTEETYSDFILEVDVLINEVRKKNNSGIQIRSESKPGYKDGKVHGYQCEIDPSDRGWSAGIFDEGRRGWLYPLDLNPTTREAFKLGEWNHFRIECIGPSIKTWLNGLPVAHVIDDLTRDGFIALQMHTIGNNKEEEGQQIMWKNIRIKTNNLKPSTDEGIYVVNLIPNNLSEVEKAQGFELLFDGKSFDNFRSAEVNESQMNGWVVKDGMLSVFADNHESDNTNCDLLTKKEFGPFELKFEFNFTKNADSGVRYGGLEYQITNDKKDYDPKKGISSKQSLASLYDIIPAEKDKRFVQKFVNGPGEWSRGHITLFPDGKVQHWLNGCKVVEYNDNHEFNIDAKSPILFQYKKDTVHFRSIKIREL